MTISRANKAAAVAAGIAFVIGMGVLRLRGVPMLVAPGMVYLGTLAMLWPRRKRQKTVLPKGVRKDDFLCVDEGLRSSIELLRDHARIGTFREASLFREVAELVERIRKHLHGNPAHLPVIRRFARHGLAWMIQMVTDYADLKQRALPEHRPRLDAVLANMENLIPSLQKIDRACLENDLDALEISVEVLTELADRSRFN